MPETTEVTGILGVPISRFELYGPSNRKRCEDEMKDDEAIADIVHILGMWHRAYVMQLSERSNDAARTDESIDLTCRLIAQRSPTTVAAIDHVLNAMNFARALDPTFERTDPGSAAHLLQCANNSLLQVQNIRHAVANDFLIGKGFTSER